MPVAGEAITLARRNTIILLHRTAKGSGLLDPAWTGNYFKITRTYSLFLGFVSKRKLFYTRAPSSPTIAVTS